MNRLTIIGNLTRDPESHTLANGDAVCSFTMAVNRLKKGEEVADFFRVSAWGKLGESCQRYLAKGRKVAVVGPVTVSTYEGKDGVTRFNLEVRAEDVEFLTPRGEQGAERSAPATRTASSDGFVEVDDEDLPF